MADEKRLIDKDALIKLCDAPHWCVWMSEIEDFPEVDAVEVVHGRWEKAEYHGFLRCSECKDVYIDDTWVADGKWNYCPNCGAKMDGGADNGG